MTGGEGVGSIDSPRLRLRRLDATDDAHLVALDADPEVMRYLSGGRPTPPAAIRDHILPRMRAPDPVLTVGGFWAVDERATNAFAGWVCLRSRDLPDGTAELGFRFHRRSWGRGYATEAARALLDAAFARDPLARVVATTYERNLGSIRVMEKLGMTLVRRFRYEPDAAASDTFVADAGEVWDGHDAEYALDRANWDQRESDAGDSSRRR